MNDDFTTLRTGISGGNLGNQLYLVLQAYRASQRGGWCKYLVNAGGKKCGFLEMADVLNVDRYVTAIDGGDAGLYLPNDSYQAYGSDFSQEELHGFIKETILCSRTFADIRRSFAADGASDRVLCINIRNGDFIRYPNKIHWACYDRERYFRKSFEAINTGRFNRLDVASDDNCLNRRLYDRLFKEYFPEVRYLERTTPSEDILRISLYRHKVIMNSTFSYWAAFIGDAFYGECDVIAPDFFCDTKPRTAYNCNPAWKIVNVETRRLQCAGIGFLHLMNLLWAAATFRPLVRKLVSERNGAK